MYSRLSKAERFLFVKVPDKRHPRLWALLFLFAGCVELVEAYLEAGRFFPYPLSLLFFGVAILMMACLYVTPPDRRWVVLGLRILVAWFLILGAVCALLGVYSR
jgi:hypothetical protein